MDDLKRIQDAIRRPAEVLDGVIGAIAVLAAELIASGVIDGARIERSANLVSDTLRRGGNEEAADLVLHFSSISQRIGGRLR